MVTASFIHNRHTHAQQQRSSGSQKRHNAHTHGRVSFVLPIHLPFSPDNKKKPSGAEGHTITWCVFNLGKLCFCKSKVKEERRTAFELFRQVWIYSPTVRNRCSIKTVRFMECAPTVHRNLDVRARDSRALQTSSNSRLQRKKIEINIPHKTFPLLKKKVKLEAKKKCLDLQHLLPSRILQRKRKKKLMLEMKCVYM